ncbi:MAG: radical SAM protein [Planctomycetia bacterium]|nr:radical SAM protein [Planctomycetia bacterium]
MKCKMCDIWQNQTDKKLEITYQELDNFLSPNSLEIINVTGGEPFMRSDLEEIVEVCFKKSKRVVISTAGWHVNKIIKLANRFPQIGIRISIEGLCHNNDRIRGHKGGFDRIIKALNELRNMGIKDIGFGITASYGNSGDMLELYELSKALGYEFATATLHNSFYFHKKGQLVPNVEQVKKDFSELVKRMLKEKKIKSWYRAWFNLGLINYLNGKKRMLPCEAGTVNYFIEPYGDVYPCNGLEEIYWKKSMGNIKDYQNIEDLWYSDQANKVRNLVKTCPKNCWMIGTASPVMRKYPKGPTMWVIKNKINSILNKPIDTNKFPHIDVGQNPKQGDLRL